ncbi:glutaredoxin domain-containing protein [uncultured Clostridium sp.]|uniref:glutaredoxin family protein n=1 Tax=uncultured Clostridium sp. TaxID=59620 RepID=UPI0025F9A9FA|nr:glutaredoxin domain-containing protein [uncultured Clostridium sp.]
MIKIYSTSWCPECIQVKKYLDYKGIEYSEINVADRQEDREEVIKVSGQKTVPVIEIDGTVIVGFNRALIDKAINK